MTHLVRTGSIATSLWRILLLLAALVTAVPAFAQATGAPAPYRLQPGDEVLVSVLRLEELNSQSAISPDGMLYLKNIGAVKAAGATVAELEQSLEKILLKRLRNPRVTVTIFKLVQPVVPPRVTVLGEVEKPGPVNLEDGLRVKKAIELAGGAAVDADLSRVLLLRNDFTRHTLDLRDEESAADPKRNWLLADGDSIFVPGLSKVTVIGEVGKPGPVDLEEGLRVRKALDLAGGTTKSADLTQVTIFHRDLTRQVVDLSTQERVTDSRHNIALKPGDSVEVLPLPRITVTGAVTKPGTVDQEEGLRVRKAIELAGGALRDADLTRVVVVRRNLTRHTVNVADAEAATDPKQNLLLEPGDSIDVPLPYQVGSVTIRGEGILNPGSYELKPGWGVDDLIVAAGKLTLVADTENVQIIRGGRVAEKINLLERLKQGAEGKAALQPGDEVFIPKHEAVVVLVGPVPNPGPRALRKGQTVSEFLREGDPQTTVALDPSKVDFGKVELHRKGQKPIRLSLKKVLGNPDHESNLELQSGDLLFLPPKEREQKAGLVDWLRSVPYIGMFANLF